MKFLSPAALWALLLVPVAAGAYLAADARRRRASEAFVGRHMRPNVLPETPSWRRYTVGGLYLLGLAALLVAPARPQASTWTVNERATLAIALDTSNSMQATDIDPNRLAAARRATLALMEDLPQGVEVGLVGFSSGAQVLSLPTDERGAIRDALDAIVLNRGTAMGDGIQAALDMRPQDVRPRVPMAIVVVSDGNNTTGEIEPVAAADIARRSGVPVHVIALESNVSDPGSRFRAPDPDELRRVAEAGGGRYLSAASPERLEEIYDELGSRLARTRDTREISATFAAAGALLLIVGALASLLWFRRIA